MTAIDAHDLVFIDIEHTGFTPPEPIEFAVVGVDDRLERISTWEQMFNPRREINWCATKVHGLTNSDLKKKPMFERHSRTIEDLLSGKIIVAHGVKNDVDLIRKKIPRLVVTGFIDTDKMVRALVPELKKTSLTSAAEHLEIEAPNENEFPRGAHSAGYDAVLSLEVFKKLLQRPGSDAWLKSCGYTIMLG